MISGLLAIHGLRSLLRVTVNGNTHRLNVLRGSIVVSFLERYAGQLQEVSFDSVLIAGSTEEYNYITALRTMLNYIRNSTSLTFEKFQWTLDCFEADPIDPRIRVSCCDECEPWPAKDDHMLDGSKLVKLAEDLRVPPKKAKWNGEEFRFKWDFGEIVMRPRAPINETESGA